MTRNPLIYLDNRWLRLKSARISPLDRGFLYGDGVFETLRIYQGHIFKRSEHLQRLFNSANQIGLTIPKDPDNIGLTLNDAIRKNKIKNGILRITCTRGQGAIGLDPSLSTRPTFLIMAFPLTHRPRPTYEKGLSLVVVKTVRNISEAIPNNIKSSNFLNNILAKIEAKERGADEGLMLNHQGYLTEGTSSNLFYVQRGILCTPSRKSGILEGITRGCVIEISKTNGIKVKETLVKTASLERSDECFITSTGLEIAPATQVNGKLIGSGKPGPLTRRLMALLRNYIQQSISSGPPSASRHRIFETGPQL